MRLPFPPAALKQHVIILGKTGAGKSTAMRDIVEYVLLGNQSPPAKAPPAPVCIIDPKGDWWGLKTSADGKSGGFPVAIFGGEHADMPLTPRAGTALAEIVVNAAFPCLIDLGGWSIGERTRFSIDLVSRYFKLAKGTRFLFIDEVHNFVPKGKIPDPDTGKMLHWFNRLASEGRGKGITLVAASQRPQKVHNDFLTSMETLLALRVIHKADRSAYRDWIEGAGDMALGKEVLDTVADLKRGQAWAWSPEIKFGPKVIQFPMFTTYDSFKPQEVDARELSAYQVDLSEVRERFAAFVQEAQQNDPAILRKRIAELEAKLAREARNIPVSAQEIDGHRKQAFEQGRAHGAKDERDSARDKLSSILGQLDTLRDNVSRHYLAYSAGRAPGNELMRPAEMTKLLLERKPPRQAPVAFDMEVRTAKPARALPYTVVKDDAEGTELMRNPTGLRAKILAALRWFETVGMTPAPRAALGGVADFVPDKGYGARTLGELKTDGLVTYPQPGTIELTESGRVIAPEPPAYGSLIEAWRSTLSGLHKEVLEVLAADHPQAISRETLGEVLGKQFEQGYGARVLGELKTMGVLEYPAPGSLKLTRNVIP